MFKRLLFKQVLLIIFSFLVLLAVLNTPVFAAGNIQFISDQNSEKEIVIKTGDKLMLDKKWYSYKFEVNPGRTLGAAKMQPVDAEEYEAALNEVSFPLEAVGQYKVYFLNYRLKNYSSAMALSFKDDSAVVFGTYYPLSASRLHQLAAHELGHQVDFCLMSSSKWREYKRLRGLENKKVYNDQSTVYENRPQEIFAEDFRLLFGGETARIIPHLNEELPDPGTVSGLKELFLELASA